MSWDPHRPLIFVTVGTDHHPFDRLVGWVDEWLRSGGNDRADAFAQTGTSAAPQLARSSPYLGRDEMADMVESAVCVVCHGGPGTIQEARRQGFLPIVVPRESGFGEHVDDHQVAYSSHLAEKGEVLLARSETDFRKLLDRALDNPDDFRLATPVLSEQELAVARFERIIENASKKLESRANAPAKVLFIAGVGRSGTTLLDQMLGQVHGFHSVGELVHMWLRGLDENDLCACGAPFQQCAFWSRVGDHAFGGWETLDSQEILDLQMAVDRHRYLPMLLEPRPWPRYRGKHARFTQLLGSLYKGVQEVSGARFIVDSSKYVSYAYLLRRVPGIDLRVVHLVRESHGVVYSWTKRVRRPEVTHGEAYMPTYHPARMALRWTFYNLCYEALPRLDVPTLRLRYESLVSEPHRELQRILEFAGEDPDEYDLGFLGDGHVDLGETHSCSGNPMRFGTRQVPLRLDRAWE